MLVRRLVACAWALTLLLLLYVMISTSVISSRDCMPGPEAAVACTPAWHSSPCALEELLLLLLLLLLQVAFLLLPVFL